MDTSNEHDIEYDPGLLQALRAFMRGQNLDAFLVPHADEHQSEYLPPSAERLARLTGFHGSAGFAIVLHDGAALFVDGRYTIQAKAEVDTQAFQVFLSSETSPSKWLNDNLRPATRVAYDPWLFTPAQVEGYKKVCDQAQAELVALDANPIDALWTSRPPTPSSPVEVLPPEFTPLSSQSKRKEIGEALAKSGARAAVITAGDSLAWLFNVRANDVPFTPLVLAQALIFDDGHAELFIEPNRLSEEARTHLQPDITVCPPDDFGKALDRLGKDKAGVRISPTITSAWIVDRLTRAGARLLPGEDPCTEPKAKKTEREIIGVQNAHRRDAVALIRFLKWLGEDALNENATELSAAAKLDGLRGQVEHFRGLSFPTISGSGPNGAIVHYRVTQETDRALQPGELYLVDSGGQYLDGTTDVTRTVAIGAPNPKMPSPEMPSPEMKDRFTRVLKGHIAISSQRFPQGTKGEELDVLARRALWDAGLDYNHGTGHGVGTYLGVHEGPHRIAKCRYGRGNAAALAIGMVVSNEPGYYKEGAFGIRIENLITVVGAPTPDGGEAQMLGFEPLTLAPIDLNLVDVELLSKTEIDWLNAYHQRVFDEVAPALDATTRAWLSHATRPLDRPVCRPG